MSTSPFYDPKKHDKGARKGPKKHWPAFRFNADFPEGKIFQKPEDVPDGEGWVDHPSKIVVAPPAPLKSLKADVPAETPAKGSKGSKKAPPPPAPSERDIAVAALTKAGYDPAELASASDEELATALKDVNDGANN